MEAKKFIDEKSDVLAKYLDYFLMRKLSYSQLNIFDESTDSCKEQVLWFLLFELKNWSSQQIFANRILRQKLHTGALFLQGQGVKPYNCIGIRPITEYLD